jgi:hypothetical protein
MRFRTFTLVLGLAVFLLSTAAFATGNGDVTIKVNGQLPDGGAPQAIVGWDNTIEIWITNDAPLYGISLALSFDAGGIPIHLVTPYGMYPWNQPYVNVYSSMWECFDPEGLQVTTELQPNTILIQGTATSDPLPVHLSSTRCYTVKLHMSCGSALFGQLAINNVYLEPNGTWMFDDGTPYAPTFQGQPNTSTTVPDAPAVIFEAGIPPCGFPYFATTPNSVETISHCSEFKFTFGALDSKCGKGPLEFSSTVGDMNPTTGQFTLLPGLTCTSTQVTATVINSGCMTDEFTFTVNWIDGPPNLTNCPTTTGHVKPYGLYEYPFAANDPDACDKVTFEVAPFMCDPAGEYMVDSTGKFGFIPIPVDSGHTYVFTMIAKGGCNLSERCPFAVEVGAPICGDANGDGIADISDIVYLITYIFQGGLQPNPLLSGDINCDATVDISDAVYFITYIFSGGPQPCQQCL